MKQIKPPYEILIPPMFDDCESIFAISQWILLIQVADGSLSSHDQKHQHWK